MLTSYNPSMHATPFARQGITCYTRIGAAKDPTSPFRSVNCCADAIELQQCTICLFCWCVLYLLLLSSEPVHFIALWQHDSCQEDGNNRMQAGNNRTAADLSQRTLEFSAVPQSNMFIITASEQTVLLLWTAGNAAHSSLVTLPALCLQQGLSRCPIERQGAAYCANIAIRWA